MWERPVLQPRCEAGPGKAQNSIFHFFPPTTTSPGEATCFGKWKQIKETNSQASHSALISVIINRALINYLSIERKS